MTISGKNKPPSELRFRRTLAPFLVCSYEKSKLWYIYKIIQFVNLSLILVNYLFSWECFRENCTRVNAKLERTKCTHRYLVVKALEWWRVRPKGYLEDEHKVGSFYGSKLHGGLMNLLKIVSNDEGLYDYGFSTLGCAACQLPCALPSLAKFSSS